tara:strand:+ start:431 stop:781 length:351 start_codon:yes stop_codon:yes gene_type:complete
VNLQLNVPHNFIKAGISPRIAIEGSLLLDPELVTIVTALAENEVDVLLQNSLNLVELTLKQWVNALVGTCTNDLRPPFEAGIERTPQSVRVTLSITRRALGEWWDVYGYLVLQGIR